MNRLRLGLRAIGQVFVVAGLLAGCCGCWPPSPPPPLPPSMTLEQVVLELDHNNDLLAALKGSFGKVGGRIVEPDGKTENLDILGLNGLLIYAQPGNLFMDLSKAGDSRAQLGSNDQLYWMWVAPPGSQAQCWVGSYQEWNPAVGGGLIPIHPRLLGQLLGIDPVRPDLHGPPWPVLRISEPQDRANIVQFLAPVGGRLLLRREMWISRDTNLPSRVRLFNGEGQVVMESKLSDWRPVSGSAAKFPHDVEINAISIKSAKGGVTQEPGSSLHLVFAGVQVDQKFSPANNPRVFRFRCPADVKIVPLDNVAAAATQAAAGDAD